jgi:hypothetical protein
MKETTIRKALPCKVKIAVVLAACCAFFSELGAAGQTNWTPAYNDEQLDIINNALSEWKPSEKYPRIKDIFHNRSYEPDWRTANADATPWDLAPDSFKDEQEALKAGCQCDYLKSMEKKTGLLKLALGQGAWIFTYDPDSTGRFNKSGVITLPTWYGFASVALVNVLGRDKPKFILIEHVGDHGTGIDENIHWLIGWHEGAFHTVFREIVHSTIDWPGEDIFYQMNYRIVKGKEPRIETKCQYEQVDVAATPYDFHSSWRDWFFWNEKEFSFYDPKVEEEEIQDGVQYYGEPGFRLNLETNRVNILKMPPLPQRMWDDSEVEKYWNAVDRTE